MAAPVYPSLSRTSSGGSTTEPEPPPGALASAWTLVRAPGGPEVQEPILDDDAVSVTSGGDEDPTPTGDIIVVAAIEPVDDVSLPPALAAQKAASAAAAVASHSMAYPVLSVDSSPSSTAAAASSAAAVPPESASGEPIDWSLRVTEPAVPSPEEQLRITRDANDDQEARGRDSELEEQFTTSGAAESLPQSPGSEVAAAAAAAADPVERSHATLLGPPSDQQLMWLMMSLERCTFADIALLDQVLEVEPPAAAVHVTADPVAPVSAADQDAANAAPFAHAAAAAAPAAPRASGAMQAAGAEPAAQAQPRPTRSKQGVSSRCAVLLG